MEEQIRRVAAEELLEHYRTLLETVEELPLRVSGNSMSPFLVHDRDTVYLTRPKGPPRVGDMVLYRRESGAYILHRVCRVEGERFCAVGDAQTEIERGLAAEQIIAVVCRAVRKGRRQAPGRFWWEFFARLWVRVIPCRPALVRVYGAVSQWFRR